MFDQTLNVEEELAEIPPEYQDIFRQTLERELAESEQNHTDMEILTYLRRRREDFKNGGFIRPDGRPGLVALNPEAVYEQAMSEIVKDTLGQRGNPAERRRTLIKVGLLIGVALAFLFFVLRGRGQDETVAAQVGDSTSEAVTAVPTAPLPEITGAEESLQTIGGLGGALVIGRPSAIELHYQTTEETIALAIDPSRPTPRGELRFNEATMRSDNPVAVWLFGTVLNYAIGVPDSMVRNLEPGDTVILSTDTGAALRFIVAETRQGTNYEAGRLLSQNRLGLTLFALPAVGEEAVAFALANYDVTSEEGEAQLLAGLGEPVSFGLGGEVVVNDVAYSHTTDGELRIAVNSSINGLNSGQSVLLSLADGSDQTTAVELMPDEIGIWEADFTVQAGRVGEALLAEFRFLPDGGLAVVRLGDIPRLIDQLAIEITGAWWESDQAIIAISLHNLGEGAVYINPDFIQFPGGDAYEGRWQTTPSLPFLIGSGETREITVSFRPQTISVQIQIGAGLWEVTGIPLGIPSPPTGQQPANGGG